MAKVAKRVPYKGNRKEAQVDRFHHCDIVVIGGSAGSIEPLKRLLSSLPAGLPVSIFVTVHVSPQTHSILPEILTRAGPIRAVHALKRQPIMKSMIYVASPDYHLLIEDSSVFSGHGPRENLSRPSIDPLFRSAARSYGPRVMGIILSGLLNDGSSGLLAVKFKGGLTVVQDPAEAAFPGMPEHARYYADARYVLRISEIERLLINSVQSPREASGSDLEAGSSAEVDAKASGSGALGIEVRSAAIEDPPVGEHLGMPSVYACPDCHGVLWEIKEEKLLRYRCRVGHSYTAETLYVAMTRGRGYVVGQPACP